MTDQMPRTAYWLISYFILPTLKEIPTEVTKFESLPTFEALSPFSFSSCSSLWALKTSDGIGPAAPEGPGQLQCSEARAVQRSEKFLWSRWK